MLCFIKVQHFLIVQIAPAWLPSSFSRVLGPPGGRGMAIFTMTILFWKVFSKYVVKIPNVTSSPRRSETLELDTSCYGSPCNSPPFPGFRKPCLPLPKDATGACRDTPPTRSPNSTSKALWWILPLRLSGKVCSWVILFLPGLSLLVMISWYRDFFGKPWKEPWERDPCLHQLCWWEGDLQDGAVCVSGWVGVRWLGDHELEKWQSGTGSEEVNWQLKVSLRSQSQCLFQGVCLGWQNPWMPETLKEAGMALFWSGAGFLESNLSRVPHQREEGQFLCCHSLPACLYFTQFL